MGQIAAMVRKEFQQTFRTREMLAIIFVVPLIQMLVLGFAITNEVRHVRLIISDHDNSRLSRNIIRKFDNTEQFDIIDYETDLERIKIEMQEWRAQAALVIPPGFGRDLIRGLKPELQMIVDGLDGNSAGVALGYAQRIIAESYEDLLSSPVIRSQLAANDHLHAVKMVERMWYNPDLRSAQYMVPGIVVVLLTIIPMMLSSMSLVREKEIGTLEQLMVTPLKKHQLLLGKLIPFLILSFVELGIVLKAAQLIFSIEMQGSYLLLGVLAFGYLFTTLGQGIFVSIITSSQQQAMFVSWFFMVFMILMSGFFIPIENMPEILQKVTYLNPMRYIMSIMRDIFQKGSNLSFLLKDVIPMMAFGLVIFSSSVLGFRKRVG